MFLLLKISSLALILLLSTSVLSQNQPSTGKATASGNCAVSHSGNNDTIIIQNCGIGKEEADKITEMLRAVLANQKTEERDAKIDQLLDLAKRALNAYGTVSTYDPNGMRRDITSSTGEINLDDSANKDFAKIQIAMNASDWQSLLELAQAAASKYPGWFTPYYCLGFAQANLCMKQAAKNSWTKFLKDAQDATAYTQLVSEIRTRMQMIEGESYLQVCPVEKQK